MDSIIKAIGIVFVVAGIVYLLKPGFLKAVMEFFKQGNRLYLPAVIRLALAVVFLLAARECKIPWVIMLFGIIFLVSGLLILVLGLEKVKVIIDWWQKKSVLLLRFAVIVGAAIGAIIIYCA